MGAKRGAKGKEIVVDEIPVDPPSDDDTTQLSARIPTSLFDELKSIGKERGTSMTTLVIHALRFWVAQYRRKKTPTPPSLDQEK